MSKLQIIEVKNQRILTTAQLAEWYGTNERRISGNYAANKNKYEAGKHFYCLEGEELADFKNRYGNSVLVGANASRLYLWTERGALLHAKSLGTDRAWEVYERLVETYFRAREAFAVPKTLSDALYLAADLQKKIEEQQPLVAFAKTAARSNDSILVRELAKICCKDGIETGEKRLYQTLRKWGHIQKDSTEPYQEYVDRGYYEVAEGTREGKTHIHLYSVTRVLPRGQQYIMKRLRDEHTAV